jgi:phosphoribosylformylglycinamidine synthase
MRWKGQTIVDLSRDFLNSNGARRYSSAVVKSPEKQAGAFPSDSHPRTLSDLASDLAFCSRQGLTERFCGSIGAASVLMPFGGRTQKLRRRLWPLFSPFRRKDRRLLGNVFGFDPYLSDRDPFAGADCAVTESLAKLAASGCDIDGAYLTFQEYFRRLGEDPERWGLPLASLLGAFAAQEGLGVAAIGGKDSMSGCFWSLTFPIRLYPSPLPKARAARL